MLERRYGFATTMRAGNVRETGDANRPGTRSYRFGKGQLLSPEWVAASRLEFAPSGRSRPGDGLCLVVVQPDCLVEASEREDLPVVVGQAVGGEAVALPLGTDQHRDE